jgi:acyl carrier protein
MTPRLYADLMMTGRLAGGSVRSPFDARADGHVPGEGCGALLLKRLADARRDNDPILGILRGVGAAYEQTADEAANLAISRALHDGGLRPADVGAIEIAASGELDSDMSEIQGIVDAYRQRASSPRLVMGTVVGQIGHTGGASGMASLLKANLEIENAAMLPDAGLEKPAPHITRHSAVLTIPNGKPVTLAGSHEGRLIAGVHSGGTREVAYHVLLERATKLKANELRAPKMKPLSAKPSLTPGPQDGVVEFDATVRRREKKRGVAAGAQISQQPDQPPVKTDASPRVAPVARSQETTKPPIGQQPVRPVRPPVTMTAAPTPPPPPSSSPLSPATSHSPAKSNGDAAAAQVARSHQPSRLSEKDLEKFLINFVVEQTGYPPEIVELDADLEADLGIDSIKKAQLFGELGEYFEVQPAENMSLDDFPTLRHVLAVLVNAQNPTSNGQQKNAEAPATVGSVAPKAAPRSAAVSQPSSPANHTRVKSNGDLPETVTAPSSNPSQLNPNELEKFLINFVVEQTGYPPEIVELDADLEADLGIDSIKKAQLFGELSEYFEVQPSENMSLDDFPTLRHVLAVLLTAQSRETSGSAVATPTPAADAATALRQAPNASTPASVTRQAAQVTPTPAVRSEYGHVHVKSNGASAASQNTASGSTAPRLDAAELERFLINFVVEQTGYPPEIVELDADLEADLGIDSIKKAQLFGELGEYFEVQTEENMSLDDFPTLRHVLAVLIVSQNKQPAQGT